MSYNSQPHLAENDNCKNGFNAIQLAVRNKKS